MLYGQYAALQATVDNAAESIIIRACAIEFMGSFRHRSWFLN